MTEFDPLLRNPDVMPDNPDNYELPVFSEKSEIPEQIIAALCSGDHDAYTIVFNAYHAPVKRFLSMMLRSENIAQEMTQEVFINLWLKREKINPRMNIKGFLYTTAKFFMLNYLKHQKVISKYEEYKIQELDFADDPHDIAVGKELSLLIDIAIAKMPPQQGLVFKMKYNECKSIEEIANLLRISQETVKVHLKRGRSEVRDILAMFTILCM